MITAETCEDYYKQLHNLMPDVHPADLIVQVLHDFLRERGMGKKEGSTALERMVGFIEEMAEREKEALDYAVAAIYFDDSSDYKKALYGVVGSITGVDEEDLTDEYIRKLL